MQEVILNVSHIFLARIKVWSKLLRKKFFTDSPGGLWRYKIKCYLLINFNILEHNAWYTQSCLQKCLAFQDEPDERLLVQSQQLEHVWNMFIISNKDTRTTSLSSLLIVNSFCTLFLCFSCNFQQVIPCCDRWCQQSLSK